MIINFLCEEKGQAAIEYILLVGGVIVSTITVFTIYGQMTRSTAVKLNSSTQAAADNISAVIEKRTPNITSL